MSDAAFSIVVLLFVAGFAFLFGMQFGSWYERRWQIQKRKMNRKLRHDQREVDRLCSEYITTTQVRDYIDQRIN